MKFPTITKFLVTCAVLVVFSNENLLAQNYDLNTTFDTYWPAESLEKPNYLENRTDPTFGVKITRITGNPGTSVANVNNETWRNVSRHGYQLRQPWNADETILYMDKNRTAGGGWGQPLFLNGETYEPISTANSQPSGNEHRWHPTNPSLRLYLTDNAIKTWNFHSNEVITLMSFSGYSNTSLGYSGNWSDDGHKIAMFATRNSDGRTVAFALDTQNNIKYPDVDLQGVSVDDVSISPLGNYIMVNANFGDGGDRKKIYDLDGNQVGPYWSEYGRPSHFDLIADENGNEYAVGVDKSSYNSGRVIKRNLATGEAIPLTTGGWAIHTSSRALGRPGWVFASMSSSTNWGPYLNEIVAIKLDGSRIERICSTRTVLGTYENEAHACPSPSGSRIIFASDWDNNDYPIQGYVADFREFATAQGFQVDAGEDQYICENNEVPVTLTATGADSYVWNTGETTASISVNPTNTTTYTVTGSENGSTQTTTDEVTVTVTPMPEANAGADVEICEDNSTTLTASGGDTYQWNTGQTSQTISVSPQSTTTYTVTVTQNGCSSSDQVVVTVLPRPSVNAGNDVDIYLSESTTLTAVGEGALEWSTGETGDTITVSPTQTTTYTVTATLNGCSSSDDVIVTVTETDTVTPNAGADVSICEGESTTLTASGGTDYLWNTGETTPSITVNPSTTTTYTVTVTNGTASGTDDVVVTVNPIPVANAGNDVAIELGETTTLSASGGTSFLWNTGETTQNISVSPTETTTYTVEVFSNGCSTTDLVTVIVNYTVNANAGGDVSICFGSSTTLTASGGQNYLWNTGETTPNITVSPTQTTTYSVTVSTGNVSETDDVIVTVNPNPNANAGNDITIESGTNTTLSASGGNSYLWDTGDTSQNISVSPSETTTYTVEAIINGCSDFDEVTVTVVPALNPNAGADVTICLGDPVQLIASGGTTYEWNTGDITETITVIPTETTEYTVTVSNGISTGTDTVTVYIDDCSETEEEDPQENLDFEYLMYPNPSRGIVYIKLSGLENISSIYISDSHGRVIQKHTLNPENGQLIVKKLNLLSLAKGVYFVTFIQSGSEITKKLVLY